MVGQLLACHGRTRALAAVDAVTMSDDRILRAESVTTLRTLTLIIFQVPAATHRSRSTCGPSYV